jgi:PPK2 family polyphosphate:nucleotide phosphotransferase
MTYANLIEPKSKVKLADFDAGFHAGLTEEVADAKFKELSKEISELQELLYAAQQNSLLIVLQGRDTSGKDGSIRHISSYLNTLSTIVTPFKAPNSVEAAHDFLWRVHRHTPAKGHVAIFNRSHYEDVLAVRVHNLAPEKVWEKRYKQINQFEELLVENKTIIVKLYLHISKKEQEQRLLAREQDPDKSWKLSVADWKERETWPEMTEAYEDALEKCSTEDAPWHLISANHKWFRDLAIAEAIHDALSPKAKGYKKSLKHVGEIQKAALVEYRKEAHVDTK